MLSIELPKNAQNYPLNQSQLQKEAKTRCSSEQKWLNIFDFINFFLVSGKMWNCSGSTGFVFHRRFPFEINRKKVSTESKKTYSKFANVRKRKFEFNRIVDRQYWFVSSQRTRIIQVKCIHISCCSPVASSLYQLRLSILTWNICCKLFTPFEEKHRRR